MEQIRKNYYGSLCTELYEILHKEAPADELRFYFSYAEKGMKILEPLCGSGRFLVPFLKEGYDICGMDLSGEMLEKLKQKAPDARVIHADLMEYATPEKFDYIFIPSGSLSLFTDISVLKNILRKIRGLLKRGGKFVFAVDTVASRCPDHADYKTAVSVRTREGFDLVLKSKDFYDEANRTQFSPAIYALYDGTNLLQSEEMDFQTHLYELGEMEQYLQETGWTRIAAYSSFDKQIAVDYQIEMLLYECSY